MDRRMPRKPNECRRLIVDEEGGLPYRKGFPRLQDCARNPFTIDHHAIGGPEVDDGDGAVTDDIDGQVLARNVGIRYKNVATLITADDVHADFQRKFGVVAN